MVTTIDSTIRSMHATGTSQRRIAIDLGVTRHRVSTVLRQGGELHQRAPIDGASAKGLAGRVSRDTAGRGKLSSFGGLIDSKVTESIASRAGIDSKLLSPNSIKDIPFDKLCELITEASPEAGKALWDYLRMAANGYEITAYKPGPGKDPYDEAQARLNQFREHLRWEHGDESVIYRRLFIAAWIRGGMIGELVMDERGREPVDIATPDPANFGFRYRDGKWRIGQWQDNEWVEMDRVTFRHVQIDPRPGKPHGVAPVANALFPCLFLLGLYQDLRRVIANQGYPRLDIEIDTEALATLADPEELKTPEEWDQFLSEFTGIIANAVDNMGPGDAYAHASFVKMNAPIGAIGSELASISSIIEGLERMVIRGLKATPLMMAIDKGVSEANANRQWEMWVETVKAIQKPAEILIETLYELALQAYGIIADVEVRFATIRAAEAFRDAQTQKLEIENAGALQDRGWLTPREAAFKATGEESDAIDATYDENADGSASIGSGDDTAGSVTDPPPEPDDDEQGDERLVRIGEVIPPVPTTVNVGQGDELEAMRRFDEIEDDYAGLLEASLT